MLAVGQAALLAQSRACVAVSVFLESMIGDQPRLSPTATQLAVLICLGSCDRRSASEGKKRGNNSVFCLLFSKGAAPLGEDKSTPQLIGSGKRLDPTLQTGLGMARLPRKAGSGRTMCSALARASSSLGYRRPTTRYSPLSMCKMPQRAAGQSLSPNTGAIQLVPAP